MKQFLTTSLLLLLLLVDISGFLIIFKRLTVIQSEPPKFGAPTSIASSDTLTTTRLAINDLLNLTSNFSTTTANTFTGLQAFSNTSTTTFAAGVSAGTKFAAPYFDATSTTATSTFSYGVQLLAGCVSVAGTCISAPPSAANPTASLGLTAINGTAATFMRSDAAPALDQTIAPTMTGNWAFSPASATTTFSQGIYSGTKIAAPYFNATSTTATSTFKGNVDVVGTLRDESIVSALFSADANGFAQAYAGSSCTAPLFIQSLNGAGVATCAYIVDLFTHPSPNISATTSEMRFTGGLLSQASSTFLSLVIPATSTPQLTTRGQLVLNVTSASTSLQFYDGTTRFALHAETDGAFVYSTSTAVAGTTTLIFAGPIRQTKYTQMGCNSLGGTFNVQLGNGQSSSTMVTSSQIASTTYTTLSTNNVFYKGDLRYVAFGTPSATGITQLSCVFGKILVAE